MEPLVPVLPPLPHTRYFPEVHLVTWHPQGILDGGLVDQVIAFLESEEESAEQPFHRFTDLTGLTDVRLKFGHVFSASHRRRSNYPWREPVKSAFYCESIIGFGLARLYETLMEGGPIHVRAFRTREAAAEWLEVSVEILRPEV